jgi:hypothetical protein
MIKPAHPAAVANAETVATPEKELSCRQPERGERTASHIHIGPDIPPKREAPKPPEAVMTAFTQTTEARTPPHRSKTA